MLLIVVLGNRIFQIGYTSAAQLRDKYFSSVGLELLVKYIQECF